MNDTPALNVTVTHVALTKAIYTTLLRCVETEAYEYGQHSDLADALKWLHYQWLLAQSKQECTQ